MDYEATYRRLRIALLEEHRRELDALDRAFARLIPPDEDKMSDSGFHSFIRPYSQRKGALLTSVRSIVRDLDGESFDINVIQQRIKESHPEVVQPVNPTSVSGTLRKLLAEGEIELVRPGSGPYPATYRASKRSGTGSRKRGGGERHRS